MDTSVRGFQWWRRIVEIISTILIIYKIYRNKFTFFKIIVNELNNKGMKIIK